jgi:DNA ligase-1
MSFKPTLAVAADMNSIQYPVLGSPKLDGIRCSIVGGTALSRTLKPIPNKAIYGALSTAAIDGLDGELIVGDPTSRTVYNDTVSKVMAHDKGMEDVTFYAFDRYTAKGGYADRYNGLNTFLPGGAAHLPVPVKLLPNVFLASPTDLVRYESECIEAGYEGVILRSLEAPYKFGRSTVKEGYLLKVKRFEDAEAEIVGFEEEMFNGNVAEKNELGRTKRSTAQAGLSGKATLGAFVVRDCTTGIEFAIGTGLTASQRQSFWDDRNNLVGALVKYKFFPVGVKIAPRHPVFLGFRSLADV